MAIRSNNCPNFNGGSHDNTNALVPTQLRNAHLHPLNDINAKNGLDKAPSSKRAVGVNNDGSPMWKIGRDGEIELDKNGNKKQVGWSHYEAGLKDTDTRYGVCLTRSNFFVFDIDTHNDIDGPSEFEKLCREAGHDLPDTFVVSTPTGGFHYYFKFSDAYPCESFKKKQNLWDGVDVFPEGQQVVGPNTKRKLDDGSIGTYKVVNDNEIMELPEWLYALVKDRIVEREAEKDAARNSRNNARLSDQSNNDSVVGLTAKQQNVLNNLCDELRTLKKGNRHADINRIVANAASFFGSTHEHEVLSFVREAAIASGHREAESTDQVDTAWEHGLANHVPFVSAPKLTNQKGAKAVKPLAGKIAKEIDSGKDVATVLRDNGEIAAKRDVPKEMLLHEVQSILEAEGRAVLTEYVEIIENGFAAGSRANDIEDEFSAFALARRFLVERTEYKYVVPEGATGRNAGIWHKYISDGRNRDCGIYKPYNIDNFRTDLINWFDSMYANFQENGDDVRAGHAKKARNSFHLVDEIIRQLQGSHACSATALDFDNEPFKIVDMTGIRNLVTGEVQPHSPNFLATRKIYFRGDANLYEEKKEMVEQVMASCHPDARAFLEAMLGTVLAQRQPLSKKAVIIWGPSKDNGKTTLVEALLNVLGRNALKAPHAIAHKNPDNKYADAELDMRTLTVLDDFGAKKEVDYERLKQYIGSGETYATRQIGQRTSEIRLFHTFILTCNHLPNFGRGEDVIDRFDIVEFPYKYAADDVFDPNNEWHRKRDSHLTIAAASDKNFHEAFYYYLLQLSIAYHVAGASIETTTRSPHIVANREKWIGKTNNLHSIMSEYAVADSNYFVTEKELFAFIKHTLEEQGNGVFADGTLREELEVLSLFWKWGVKRHEKKKRSVLKYLKDLKPSRWHRYGINEHDSIPDAANIYAGLRLKTNDTGNVLDPDEWETYISGKTNKSEIIDIALDDDFNF